MCCTFGGHTWCSYISWDVLIAGGGRAIIGWSKRGKSNDRGNAKVCAGRRRAIVSGEGTITCQSSGYR